MAGKMKSRNIMKRATDRKEDRKQGLEVYDRLKPILYQEA